MFGWPVAKVLGGLLVLALLALPVTYQVGRHDGKVAEEKREAAAASGAFIAAVQNVAKAGAEIARIGEALAVVVQESAQRETQAVRTVTKVIRENPDYAAVRRPADLERLRREQLEAVARAAEGAGL